MPDITASQEGVQLLSARAYKVATFVAGDKVILPLASQGFASGPCSHGVAPAACSIRNTGSLPLTVASQAIDDDPPVALIRPGFSYDYVAVHEGTWLSQVR